MIWPFQEVGHEESIVRRWVGAGRKMSCQIAQRHVALTINHISPENFPLDFLQTSHGIIGISDPFSFLRVLTDIPVLPESVSPEQEWYWDFLNRSLSADMLSLFGYFKPSTQKPFHGVWLRLIIETDEETLNTVIFVPENLLLSWASLETWTSIPRQLQPDFILSVPLIVGQLRLSANRCQALTKGDLLIPSEPFMNVNGEGVLILGKGEFHFVLEPEGEKSHQYKLMITLRRGDEMSANNDGQNGLTELAETDEGELVQPGQAVSFNDLPLELTIRCGNLSLTLGELKNLDAGSTLMVEHVTPGEALLCHGNYLLAKGELVNVNGALGFQIFRMLSGPELVPV